jgi:cytoskeleton protein RodZ
VSKDIPRRQRLPQRPPVADRTASGEAGSGTGAPTDLTGRRTVLRPPPWDRSGDAETTSFGTWLRRQREAREISLRDVAERTKISMRYLEAMEEDRFDLLPAPVFAKGFLREYARYVGLSPDEVVNHYLAVQQPDEAEPGPDQRPRARSGAGLTYGVLLSLAGLLLLALLTALAFWAERRRDTPSGVRPAIAPPPIEAAPPPPAAAAPAQPAAPLELVLDFSKDCWVEAVVDGKRSAALYVAGESMQIDAKESAILGLGNGGAVEIHVNGLPLPINAKEGEVVHGLKIDLDTVRHLQEKKTGHDAAREHPAGGTGR